MPYPPARIDPASPVDETWADDSVRSESTSGSLDREINDQGPFQSEDDSEPASPQADYILPDEAADERERQSGDDNDEYDDEERYEARSNASSEACSPPLTAIRPGEDSPYTQQPPSPRQQQQISEPVSPRNSAPPTELLIHDSPEPSPSPALEQQPILPAPLSAPISTTEVSSTGSTAVPAPVSTAPPAAPVESAPNSAGVSVHSIPRTTDVTYGLAHPHVHFAPTTLLVSPDVAFVAPSLPDSARDIYGLPRQIPFQQAPRRADSHNFTGPLLDSTVSAMAEQTNTAFAEQAAYANQQAALAAQQSFYGNPYAAYAPPPGPPAAYNPYSQPRFPPGLGPYASPYPAYASPYAQPSYEMVSPYGPPLSAPRRQPAAFSPVNNSYDFASGPPAPPQPTQRGPPGFDQAPPMPPSFAAGPPQPSFGPPGFQPAMPAPPQPASYQDEHSLTTYGGPNNAAGAPAHVPVNLFEKLKSRIWAYSSLARWTPQALDRALANVSGSQDRNAYLGYSTEDAHLTYEEWCQASEELLDTVSHLNPTVALVFEAHFNHVRGRFVPAFWPALRTYDIRTRLLHLGDSTKDLEEFDTRLFAAILIEEADPTRDIGRDAHQPPSGPSSPVQPVRNPIMAPLPPITSARPARGQRGPPPPRAQRAPAPPAPAPFAPPMPASVAMPPPRTRPGPPTVPIGRRAAAPPRQMAPLPDSLPVFEQVESEPSTPANGDLASLLQDVYAGLGSPQVIDAFKRAGVTSASQLAELAFLGGTALEDLVSQIRQSEAADILTAFQAVVLVNGIKKRFGPLAFTSPAPPPPPGFAGAF